MPYLIPTQNSLYLPLTQLSDEQYSSIRLRAMTNAFPTMVYDNGNFPTRTLAFYPVPTQQNGVELWLWEPLETYDDLDAELNLPQGYERYLKLALAIELAAEFGKEVPEVLRANLADAERNLKSMNQQVPVVKASRSLKGVAGNQNRWTYLTMVAGTGIRLSDD